MLELISHIFSTPYLWPSLGMVSAIGVFIGPLLYNGDLKATYKALVSIGVFGVFIAIIMQNHILYVEGKTWPACLQPIIFVSIIATSYTIGLLTGVMIFRWVHNIK